MASAECLYGLLEVCSILSVRRISGFSEGLKSFEDLCT